VEKMGKREGERKEKYTVSFSPPPIPYPTSAPTLYRSSIQLQFKMAAANQLILSSIPL